MPLFFVRKMYMSTSVFNIQTVDAAVPALKANLPIRINTTNVFRYPSSESNGAC